MQLSREGLIEGKGSFVNTVNPQVGASPQISIPSVKCYLLWLKFEIRQLPSGDQPLPSPSDFIGVSTETGKVENEKVVLLNQSSFCMVIGNLESKLI